MDHNWPGNVRELRNALEHAFVTVAGETITLLDLPPEMREAKRAAASSAKVSPIQEPLTPAQEAERERIVAALEQSGGNRIEAAKRLGTSRVTLWKKMRKYAIEP
jgi:transcriptional regulator of acetoin/glycerol metabolism